MVKRMVLILVIIIGCISPNVYASSSWQKLAQDKSGTLCAIDMKNSKYLGDGNVGIAYISSVPTYGNITMAEVVINNKTGYYAVRRVFIYARSHKLLDYITIPHPESKSIDTQPIIALARKAMWPNSRLIIKGVEYK